MIWLANCCLMACGKLEVAYCVVWFRRGVCEMDEKERVQDWELVWLIVPERVERNMKPAA